MATSSGTAKATSNIAKHGFDDALHPANLITLAASPSGHILYIVSTESDHRIRIISARDAMNDDL